MNAVTFTDSTGDTVMFSRTDEAGGELFIQATAAKGGPRKRISILLDHTQVRQLRRFIAPPPK